MRVQHSAVMTGSRFACFLIFDLISRLLESEIWEKFPCLPEEEWTT